ncbi:MAG: hypothetical protein KGD64_15435 [Candidatus Heimdallarchaeota archaeon]|nr:hypothetical protein [Candidatus Heimdallarchaeota archaeon]
MSLTIFTNNALGKMKVHGISETQALDAFNKGTVEKWKSGHVSVKKFSGYEIGVYWVKDPEGKYKIISVWKRGRR